MDTMNLLIQGAIGIGIVSAMGLTYQIALCIAIRITDGAEESEVPAGRRRRKLD